MIIIKRKIKISNNPTSKREPDFQYCFSTSRFPDISLLSLSLSLSLSACVCVCVVCYFESCFST